MRAISQVDTVLGSPGQHGQLGTAIPRGWPHPQTRVSPRGRGPSGRMIAVRASLAVVAIVVLVAACGGQKVYVQGAYNPKQVVLGAGTPIKDVRWLSYGGSIARAQGMLAVNDCQPTCASGHITWEPTSFSVESRS
jgi:hypothetical protein